MKNISINNNLSEVIEHNKGNVYIKFYNGESEVDFKDGNEFEVSCKLIKESDEIVHNQTECLNAHKIYGSVINITTTQKEPVRTSLVNRFKIFIKENEELIEVSDHPFYEYQNATVSPGSKFGISYSIYA